MDPRRNLFETNLYFAPEPSFTHFLCAYEYVNGASEMVVQAQFDYLS